MSSAKSVYSNNSNDLKNSLAILMHYLKIDIDNYINTNYYLKLKNSVLDLSSYSTKEKKFIKLALSTINDDDIVQFDNILRLSEEVDAEISINDILEFILDWESNNKLLNEEQLNNIFRKFNRNRRREYADKYSSYGDDVQKFKCEYDTYRRENFIYKFDDLLEYFKNNNPNMDLSFYTYNNKAKQFDFEMFHFFSPIIYQNISLLNYAAGYYDELSLTKSGKKVLEQLILNEKKKIQKSEQIYSDYTYQTYLPLVKKLSTMYNYTLDYFIKDYVKKEDWEKFISLCNWMRNRNNDFFMASIDQDDIKNKNRVRLIAKEKKSIISAPFKELTKKRLQMRWRLLKNPIRYSDKESYPFTYSEYLSIVIPVVEKRFDESALLECKKLSSHSSNEDLLINYIIDRDYTIDQAYQFLDIAIKKMPDEKAEFENIKMKISKGISIHKDKTENSNRSIESEEEEKILNSFFKYNGHRIKDFYQDMSIATGYGVKKISQLLKQSIANNPKLIEQYNRKCLDIRRKNREYHYNSSQVDIATKKIYIAKNLLSNLINYDETVTSKFCNTMDIDINDFNNLKYLYNNRLYINEKEASNLHELQSQFINKIFDASFEVAATMIRCHMDGELYNLYEHYEKYGYIPQVMADITQKIGNEEVGNNILDYLKLHRDIFKACEINDIRFMKTSSNNITNSNFYVDGMSISYNNNELNSAIKDLKNKGMPIQKGTLYFALCNAKKNQNTVSKVKRK